MIISCRQATFKIIHMNILRKIQYILLIFKSWISFLFLIQFNSFTFDKNFPSILFFAYLKIKLFSLKILIHFLLFQIFFDDPQFLSSCLEFSFSILNSFLHLSQILNYMSNNKKQRKNSVSESSLGTAQLQSRASRTTENKFFQMLTRK